MNREELTELILWALVIAGAVGAVLYLWWLDMPPVN